MRRQSGSAAIWWRGCRSIQILRESARWIDASVLPTAIRAADADGWARSDTWSPGLAKVSMQGFPAVITQRNGEIAPVVDRACRGERLDVASIERLFRARGGEVGEIIGAADTLRQKASGTTMRYVVNRNINYTNICEYKCAFCAFSKGKTSDTLRGKPYNFSLEEVSRRAAEAWTRGATEVCMQGGIHPAFNATTYLSLLRAVKDATPGIHVHAFSPLEIMHGAASLETPVAIWGGCAMRVSARFRELPPKSWMIPFALSFAPTNCLRAVARRRRSCA